MLFIVKSLQDYRFVSNSGGASKTIVARKNVPNNELISETNAYFGVDIALGGMGGMLSRILREDSVLTNPTAKAWNRRQSCRRAFACFRVGPSVLLSRE